MRSFLCVFGLVVSQNYYEPMLNYGSSYLPDYGSDDIFGDYIFDELKDKCEGLKYTACQKLLRDDLLTGSDNKLINRKLTFTRIKRKTQNVCHLLREYNKIFKPTEQPGKKIKIKENGCFRKFVPFRFSEECHDNCKFILS